MGFPFPSPSRHPFDVPGGSNSAATNRLGSGKRAIRRALINRIGRRRHNRWNHGSRAWDAQDAAGQFAQSNEAGTAWTVADGTAGTKGQQRCRPETKLGGRSRGETRSQQAAKPKPNPRATQSRFVAAALNPWRSSPTGCDAMSSRKDGHAPITKKARRVASNPALTALPGDFPANSLGKRGSLGFHAVPLGRSSGGAKATRVRGNELDILIPFVNRTIDSTNHSTR